MIKRLYFYSLLFFAVMLPFQFKGLPITLGLMFYSLVWLIGLGFGQKFGLIKTNRMAGFPLAYILWMVIGAIYAGPGGEAEKYLVLKVPFAAWPILLASVALFSYHHKRQLVNGFVYALLAAIVLSFAHATFQYCLTGNAAHFYFSRLVFFQMVPPHYFGMYINFAYGIVLYRFLQGHPMGGKRIFSLLMLLAFFLTLVFLSVRIQYLVFVVINAGIVFFLRNNFSLKTRLSWTVGVLLCLAALAWALPGSRSRLVDTANEIISFNEMVNDKQTNHRKFLWREGWAVVKENFWLGTGTGAGNQALNENLEEVNARFWDGKHTYYLRDRDYNYHNTYLQHWATHGLIGLGIFLAMLLYPFFKRGMSVEGKIFLGVCALSFITESMLQRQAGVLFFSFFYCVFFVMRPTAQAEKS